MVKRARRVNWGEEADRNEGGKQQADRYRKPRGDGQTYRHRDRKKLDGNPNARWTNSFKGIIPPNSTEGVNMRGNKRNARGE